MAARRSAGGPTTRSISSGAKSDDAQRLGQAGRATRDAVDAEPLARPGDTGALERHLDAVGAPGGAVLDAGLDAGERVAPSDELRVGGRAMGATAREQHDGFDQVGLAGRVVADDDLRALAEPKLEGRHRTGIRSG